MKTLISVILILISAALISSQEIRIRNKRVEREIDLTSQFSRHSVAIEVENFGSTSVHDLQFTVQEPLASKLALFDVLEERTGEKLVSTNKGTKQQGKHSYTLYSVALSKDLPPSSTLAIRAKFVFTHTMRPFPTSIAQDERQLVQYFDNHFFFSPYTTITQTTTVKLASASIESKSEQFPTSVSGNTITYGPYEDIGAFSVSEMKLHFENNKPFITATKVVKDIEISHWGANVAIEESYELQHDGAALKGTFSRFDYQRTPPGKGSVVAAMKQTLPAGAVDVYYRDEIGNISTSHLWEVESGPVMDVIPRYPLFGGWKIGFYFGYNLPSTKYLFMDDADSSHYVLETPFASCFPDISIDQLVVRIILPEGAKNAEASVPFSIDSQSSDIHFTYLDTSGRPVLVLTKNNVVPEHNQPFEVSYNFKSTSLLQEPILLIGAYFLFFVLIMVYTRISIQIGPVTKEDAE